MMASTSSNPNSCCEAYLDNLGTNKPLTNYTVLELYKHTRKHRKKNALFCNTLSKAVASLQKTKVQTIIDKIERLKKLQQKLSKDKRKEDLKSVLDDEFCFKDIVCASQLKNSDPESEGLGCQTKTKKSSTPRGKSTKQGCPLTPVKLALGEELRAVGEDRDQLRKKLKLSEEKVKKISPSKVGQRIKRKDTQLGRYKLQLRELRQRNRHLQSMIKKKEKIGEQMQHSVKLVGRGVQVNLLKKDKKLVEEVHSLQDKVLQLEDQLARTDDVIQTRSSEKGHPFLPEIRNVCHKFISSGVSADNIPNLIRTTVSLTGREVADLPSTSLLKDMAGEVGEIARQHIGEVLSTEDDLTLQRDATTKSGHHVQGLLLRAKDETTYTLGLREVPTGSAASYFEVGKDSLEDINRSCGTNVSDQLLVNISSSMTDRCVVNAAETKLWDQERDGAAERLSVNIQPIMQFYCSLHPLDQFTAVTDKVLKKFEDSKEVKIPEAFNKKSESGTHGMLRRVSSLFYKDGTGDPLMVVTFLKDHGIKNPTVLISKILGNRLNVVFHNSAGCFFIAKLLTEFLDIRENANGLQSSLLKELQHPVLMTGCRALALIGKCLTSVLWSKVIEPSMTILKMAPFINEFVNTLKKLEEDSSDLLSGKVRLFSQDLDLLKSPLAELIQPNQNDSETKALLQEMAGAMYQKAKVLFKDLLPGGVYFEPSADVFKRAESCPAENIGAERLMAQFDQSMRHSTHANQSTRESKIMYHANKSDTWLDQLSTDEKEKRLNQARRVWCKSKVVFNDRKKTLHKVRSEILRARASEKARKQQKKLERDQNLLKSLQEIGGLWTSPDEVDSNLSKCKAKLAALKVQINCRKMILHQEEDKSLFAFSAGGKQFRTDQLIKNLKELVNLSAGTVYSKDYSLCPHELVNKNIKHIWQEDAEEVIYYGRVIRYNQSERSLFIYYTTEKDCVQNSYEDSDLWDVPLAEILEDITTGVLVFL